MHPKYVDFINQHVPHHGYALIIGPAMIGDTIFVLARRDSFIEDIQMFRDLRFAEIAELANSVSAAHGNCPVFINGSSIGLAIAERIQNAKVFHQGGDQ